MDERIADLMRIVKAAVGAVALMFAALAVLLIVALMELQDLRKSVASLGSSVGRVENGLTALPDQINERLVDLAEDLQP